MTPLALFSAALLIGVALILTVAHSANPDPESSLWPTDHERSDLLLGLLASLLTFIAGLVL